MRIITGYLTLFAQTPAHAIYRNRSQVARGSWYQGPGETQHIQDQDPSKVDTGARHRHPVCGRYLCLFKVTLSGPSLEPGLVPVRDTGGMWGEYDIFMSLSPPCPRPLIGQLWQPSDWPSVWSLCGPTGPCHSSKIFWCNYKERTQEMDCNLH